MTLARIRAKVERLEKEAAARRDQQGVNELCICWNPGPIAQIALYHTAADLQAIVDVPCPAHEFRYVGPILRVPSHFALRRVDRQCCSCPPDIRRQFDEAGVKNGPTRQQLDEEEALREHLDPEAQKRADEEEDQRLRAVMDRYNRRLDEFRTRRLAAAAPGKSARK